MKTLTTQIIQQKNALSQTNAWAWLCDLMPNEIDVLYITNNSENVTWSGHTYQSFPFQVGDSNEDGQGNLSSVQLNVSNVTREFSRLVDQNRGFTGRVANLRLANINPATLAVEIALTQTFRIQHVSIDNDSAAFVLGNDDLFKLDFPQGRFFRRRCRFMYKGGLCGYVGSLPRCDKTLRGSQGCEAHQNQLRFGGFPGIPATR